MLIPAGADYFREQPDFAFSFATSSAGTMFWGMLFVLAFKGMYKKTTTAQMYLATTLSWILVCSFAAIPFVFAPFSVSYTDIFLKRRPDRQPWTRQFILIWITVPGHYKAEAAF